MSQVLHEHLQHLKDGVEDPFLSYILETKLEKNLSYLRSQAIQQDLKTTHNSSQILDSELDSISKYQQQYNPLLFEVQKNKHTSLTSIQKHYDSFQNQSHTRRYSINFDSPEQLESDIIPEVEVLDSNNSRTITSSSKISKADSDEGLAELRKRLLGNRDQDDAFSSSKSIDKQIEDQDNLQDNLLEDMTKLVGALKRGATAFQNALDEDTNVLNAAEIGMQATQRGLGDIGTKLKSYNKQKLGYMFFIFAFIFMFMGLFIVYIIIRLFPAL